MPRSIAITAGGGGSGHSRWSTKATTVATMASGNPSSAPPMRRCRPHAPRRRVDQVNAMVHHLYTKFVGTAHGTAHVSSQLLSTAGGSCVARDGGGAVASGAGASS